VFFTASTTKSFTAASVSLLVEDAASHRLSKAVPPDFTLTSTLASIVPDVFAFEDEFTTSHTTFEDALSNRTGLPDHIYSFKPKTVPVPDVIRSLRHLPRAAELRTKYLYSSYMFSTVSYAIERMTGMGLGTFMRERIWIPLGMTHTYWTPQEAHEAASSGTVLARGYAWNSSSQEFVEEAIPDFPVVSGAGAMISNVLDYAKWLQCLMTQSPPLSQTSHQTLIEPRIQYQFHSTIPFPGPHDYALGWRIDTYQGHRIIWHTGGWTGYGCTMMYIPDFQWGIVMLGNTAVSSNRVQTILYMHLLDELFNTPQSDHTDWNTELKERRDRSRHANIQALSHLYPNLPSPVSPPSLSFEELAGRYQHAGYGEMNFELHGNELVAKRLTYEISMAVRMMHVHEDSWMARLEVVNQDPRDQQAIRALFQVAGGAAKRVGLDLEPALGGKMIWFDRVSS